MLGADKDVEDREESDHRHAEDKCNALHRHVDVHAVETLFRIIRTRACDGFLYAVDDGAGEGDERPDRGDAHRARADETHLLLIDGSCKFLEGHAVGQNLRHGEVGDESRPCDGDTRQHGKSTRNADEVARTHERGRVAQRQLRHAAPDVEPRREGAAEHLQTVREECDNARNGAARKDFLQTRVGLSVILRVAADLQNLSSSDALGVGEVAVHDHCAAQGNRKENAQTAAARRDDERLPELEALPVANHEHTGDDEDDGGQRSRRRCLCLHHVVLEDVRVLCHLQHCHRDDRRRNRGRERQTYLEAEVDVRGSEDDREDRAEQHAAHGQLREPKFVLHELVLRIFHAITTYPFLR